MEQMSHDKKPLPPGTMGLPIIGETIQFVTKGTAYYTEKLKEYGNIFKCHILGSPTIRVSGADNVSTLISREPRKLSMNWPTVVHALMGPKSVPVVVGPEHSTLKKHLQKAFTPVRLADYFPAVQELVREHLHQWADRGEKGEEVLGFPACENLIADIMLELVLGCRKEDDQDGRVRGAFRDVNHNIFSVPVKIPFGGFSKALQAREVILDFVKLRMPQEETEKDYVCMMDVLLSLHGQGDGATDEDTVLDNAIGLLLAGSSSMSGALTCTLLQLGTHPDALDGVREELRAAGLFGAVAEADLSYDLLQKLDYVQCVEKELLRCLPPVGGCFRKVEDHMELDGYDIPKDWTLIYSIRDTHNSTSELLQDGRVFRPSRWQEKGDDLSMLKNATSCHYIPFGNGPRMCLGRQLARMVVHVFIVELARSFQWEVLHPDGPIVHLPVTKPRDDLPMKLTRLGARTTR